MSTGRPAAAAAPRLRMSSSAASFMSAEYASRLRTAHRAARQRAAPAGAGAPPHSSGLWRCRRARRLFPSYVWSLPTVSSTRAGRGRVEATLDSHASTRQASMSMHRKAVLWTSQGSPVGPIQACSSS